MERLHIAVGLFAALACSGLQAQTLMRANIPFEFRMGESAFPAGDYVFKYSAHLLVVHHEQGDLCFANNPSGFSFTPQHAHNDDEVRQLLRSLRSRHLS